jgi:hypothetical protein
VKSANQVEFCKPDARRRDRIDEIAGITIRPEEVGLLQVVCNPADSEGGSLRRQANGATKALTSQVTADRIQPVEAETRTERCERRSTCCANDVGRMNQIGKQLKRGFVEGEQRGRPYRALR